MTAFRGFFFASPFAAHGGALQRRRSLEEEGVSVLTKGKKKVPGTFLEAKSELYLANKANLHFREKGAWHHNCPVETPETFCVVCKY